MLLNNSTNKAVEGDVQRQRTKRLTRRRWKREEEWLKDLAEEKNESRNKS